MSPEDLTGIDVSQLDALVKFEADQRAIRALSEKATWRRDKELEVYSRVMGDYEARMTAILEQAEPVRRRVRDDLQKIEALYHRHLDALDQARVQLQECEFRHEIGEFTHEEFQRSHEAAERTIGEREAEFESVRKLRLKYLELLPGESVSQVTPVKASAAPAVTAAVPAVAKGASVVLAAAKALTPAPVPLPSASSAPPLPSAPAPTPAEPVSSAGGKTIFQRAPSPKDFKVPTPGKAAGDTEAFRTIAVSAAMLIEDRGGLPGTHHRLGMVTVIGRTQDNQIVIPTKDVSRRHAEISMVDGRYVLKDLGAPNGTFVNGERITERRLQEGDRIALGGQVFVFKAP